MKARRGPSQPQNIAYRDCMGLALRSRFVRRVTSISRPWGAPILGVAFFAFWAAQDATRYNAVALLILYLLFAVMIAVSVRWPWASLSLMLTLPLMQLLRALQPFYDHTWAVYLSIAFVAVLIGGRKSGRARYFALPILGVTALLTAFNVIATGGWARLTTASGQPIGQHPRWTEYANLSLAAFGLFAGAWAIGVAGASLRIGRVLQAADSKLAETDFELRLSQDRARISRDVHDSLAHSLAIVVSQAEGALALLPVKPEVGGESLFTIANVGRVALTDVRHLVEQIQDDNTATGWRPTTADLHLLFHNMREVGMQINFHSTGNARPLAASHDVTVFRIVQESLTNALKHAGPACSVTVGLQWREEGLAITISSAAGTPLVATSSGSRGVGIRGMKERARLAGGWLTADLLEDRQFVVSALIPVEPTKPSAGHGAKKFAGLGHVG